MGDFGNMRDRQESEDFGETATIVSHMAASVHSGSHIGMSPTIHHHHGFLSSF